MVLDFNSDGDYYLLPITSAPQMETEYVLTLPSAEMRGAGLSKHPSYLLCNQANVIHESDLVVPSNIAAGRLSYRFFGQVERLVDAALREQQFNEVLR